MCPSFSLYGRCPHGYKCRFLGAHVTPDGKLITQDTGTPPQTVNTIKIDVQRQLRSFQYPFPKSAIYIKELKDISDAQKNYEDEIRRRKAAAALDGTPYVPPTKEDVAVKKEIDDEAQSSSEKEDQQRIGPVVVAREGKKVSSL